MPLHEYLETKRRQNIRELNAAKACHICGSSSRHTGGFSRLIAQDDESVSSQDSDEVAGMRNCGCSGSTWPYSLRVCDVCIKDDATSLTGRIRHCGICGVVACDEDCGVELVECTDAESWNNAGCLECRKMEAFREIDIFKTPPPVSFPFVCSHNDSIDGPMPRMTRVCTKCLSAFTPWVKYDFVCRRFKCETRLVPSDIAERKRYCLLASSRSPLLKIIPEDGLAAIIDFLGGDELCNLYQTSSNMCLVAERVARARVEAAADQFPSGPICISARKYIVRENEPADAQVSIDPRTEARTWIYASNENNFGLRAPDDSKTWTGIYHYMEKMTAENYYFDFQSEHDGGAVCRFIAEPMEEKFVFSRTVYSKVGQSLIPGFVPRGITVKGGQVAVFDESSLMNNQTFVANEVLMLSGDEKQRFIGRLFVPSSGSLSPPTRDIIGSVGFLRIHRNQLGEERGPFATWGQKSSILEGWLQDHSVFGMEYNPANRSLMVHTFGFSRAIRSQSSTIAIGANDAESGDNFALAIELTPKAAREHALLSIRKCNNETWTQFLEHLPPETPPVQLDEDAAAAAEAVLMFDDADANDVEHGGMVRRIRRRVAARRQLQQQRNHAAQNFPQQAHNDGEQQMRQE